MSQNLLPLYHLVHQPSKKDYGDKLSLLVLVHGYGSNEEDLFGLASYFDPSLLIISVRAPHSLGPAAYAWFNIEFTVDGATAKPEHVVEGRQTLQNFLERIPEVYPVDPARIFLGGFSQGAILSLAMALHAPELISGVVAMSGRLWQGAAELAAKPQELERVPIFVSHGIWDNVLPIACGREIKQELTKLHVDLTYKEYPMGHEVSAESLSDATEWLKAQLIKPRSIVT